MTSFLQRHSAQLNSSRKKVLQDFCNLPNVKEEGDSKTSLIVFLQCSTHRCPLFLYCSHFVTFPAFLCAACSHAQEDIQSSKPRYIVQKKMEQPFISLRYDLLPTYLKQFPSQPLSSNGNFIYIFNMKYIKIQCWADTCFSARLINSVLHILILNRYKSYFKFFCTLLLMIIYSLFIKHRLQAVHNQGVMTYNRRQQLLGCGSSSAKLHTYFFKIQKPASLES